MPGCSERILDQDIGDLLEAAWRTLAVNPTHCDLNDLVEVRRFVEERTAARHHINGSMSSISMRRMVTASAEGLIMPSVASASRPSCGLSSVNHLRRFTLTDARAGWQPALTGMMVAAFWLRHQRIGTRFF